jgi:hypothetical protein
MSYPNATPEFRILIKNDEIQVLQIRFVNITQGYTGKWQDVPVVKENDANNNSNASSHI